MEAHQQLRQRALASAARGHQRDVLASARSAGPVRSSTSGSSRGVAEGHRLGAQCAGVGAPARGAIAGR